MAEVLSLTGALRLGGARFDVRMCTCARRVAITGPSGIGKSSLLRALAGLMTLGGELRVRGQPWEGPGAYLPPWRRGVGYAPQDALLLPHRTVAENLAWTGADPGPVVEGLELGPLLDRSPRHLSGGERQRVSLGRALLAARTLVLLDEPFSALDRARRATVAAWADAWCAARDLPVILVSHDEADVDALADEVWALSEAGLRGPR